MRAADHVGQIEQDAVRARRSPKDGGEKATVAAADVDDGSEAREVVAGHELAHAGARKVGHGPVEDLGLVRVVGAVLPHAPAERVDHRVLAGANAVLQLRPGSPVVVATDEPDPRRQRLGRVGAQRLSHGREREASVSILSEHAERGQRAEQPVQGRLVAPRLGRKLSGGAWAVCEQVGHAELDHDEESLCGAVAVDELPERAPLAHGSLGTLALVGRRSRRWPVLVADALLRLRRLDAVLVFSCPRCAARLL